MKHVANSIAVILVFPALATYWATSIIGNRRDCFVAHVQFLSLIPGKVGVFIRRAFLRMSSAQCSKSTTVGFGTLFSGPEIRFGEHVYIGPFGSIGEIDIDDDVLIGSHVSIPNGGKQHGIERLDVPVREQPGEWQRIRIGRDSWIGDRAIVMANVGEKCIVGAGAVVTRPVPDFAIVVGCPARVIDYRNRSAGNE